VLFINLLKHSTKKCYEKIINPDLLTISIILNMLRQKILFLWMGLCYVSLGLLMSACDTDCCCAAPAGTGTLFIFPNLSVRNNTSCGSSVQFNGITNNFEKNEANCEGKFWGKVRMTGRTGCAWEKEWEITRPMIVNNFGRLAIKITGVPLGITTNDNGDREIEVTISEPVQIGPCSECKKTDANGNAKFANLYKSGKQESVH
jgi:hypothetical protein